MGIKTKKGYNMAILIVYTCILIILSADWQEILVKKKGICWIIERQSRSVTFKLSVMLLFFYVLKVLKSKTIFFQISFMFFVMPDIRWSLVSYWATPLDSCLSHVRDKTRELFWAVVRSVYLQMIKDKPTACSFARYLGDF